MTVTCVVLMLIMSCYGLAAAAAGQPCSRPADLVFLVDTSRSIYPPDFPRQLQFVQKMIGQFNVSSGATRVAAVSFSTGYREEFQLDTYRTAEAMQEGVGNIAFTMGFTTDTADAIRHARDVILRQARPDVTRIIICITDGKSSSKADTVAEAEKTRKAGILVFAVGVGSRVDYWELGQIATRNNKEFVHTARDFKSLSSISLLLAYQTCEATAAPSTTTTLPTTTTITSTTTTTIPTTTTTTTTPTTTTTTTPTTPTTTAPTSPLTYTTTTTAAAATTTPVPTSTTTTEFTLSTGSSVSTTYTEYPQNDPASASEACGGKPADVVLVLDRSSSVYVLDFKALLHTLQAIVQVMDIAPDKTQVAAVSFSTNATVDFYLDEFATKENVIGRIGKIPYSGGVTETGQALSLVRKSVFSPKRGARGSTVARVVIVVTDGMSQDTKFTKSAAALLKKDGVHVFAVGVGQEVDHQELEDIASKPYKNFLFEVGTYEALNSVQYLLAIKACHTNI
ncbi:hypothetical protein ACOMHN_041530 [Nucella lapillus]